MASGLRNRKVAILATDGVDEEELVRTRKALDVAGAATQLISPKGGEVQAARREQAGGRFRVDRALSEASTADFVALYLPGGAASVEALREDSAAVQFVREFMASDKPVAAIGHGPLLLAEADAAAGRTLTSEPELAQDITKAGGHWVDEPVHADENLITGRGPEDLPPFADRVVREFDGRLAEREIDELSEQSFPASDAPPGPISMGGTGGTPSSSARSDGEARS